MVGRGQKNFENHFFVIINWGGWKSLTKKIDFTQHLHKFERVRDPPPLLSRSGEYLTRFNKDHLQPALQRSPTYFYRRPILQPKAKQSYYFSLYPLYLVKNVTDALERVCCQLRMKVRNAALDHITLLHCIQRLLLPLANKRARKTYRYAKKSGSQVSPRKQDAEASGQRRIGIQ